MLSTLILIPTDYEASLLLPLLQTVLATGDVEAKVCGFGPIASGIRTAQLLAEVRPSSCLLLGIAGTYQSTLPIGTAHEFTEISCYGVGAGTGSEFQSASEMGWRQWPGAMNEPPSGETLRLPNSKSSTRRCHLLTACAASANQGDVEQRLRLFPNAMAEDMEGFSVALACLSASVPIAIVRGISNHAGDRNQSQWSVGPAIEAAAKLAVSALQAGLRGSA